MDYAVFSCVGLGGVRQTRDAWLTGDAWLTRDVRLCANEVRPQKISITHPFPSIAPNASEGTGVVVCVGTNDY